ncbi:MAG: winged helix-turn-helix transcriptional regulator [Pseudomonadales bacterium]|nr:winged helix-turn-helix transcriptional regulator [Pseudomonadales bacterium]MCP5183068.1 winged helix-turn-helix transcriptional regulator [Pseudomonadales bacterium]
MNAAERLDRTFAALAEPNRRAVIELLRRQPMSAGEIANRLGLSAPALSKHLKTLRASGLVEEARTDFDARVRVYSLRNGSLKALRRWLEDTERLWSMQLSAFKAYVESADANQKEADRS